MIFDNRFEFLDHVEFLDARREVADEFFGQRPCDADFQNVGVGHDVAHVLVGDARRDDADLAFAFFDAVELAVLGQGANPVGALLDKDVPDAGVGRQHGVFLGVAVDLVFALDLDAVVEFDERLGVGHARGYAQQHRRVVFFAYLEGLFREVFGFLAVGGFEHGDFRRGGVVAVVLLVLRGVHSGIVGGNDDDAALCAGVGEREQRVGGDVETDVLHRDDGAPAGEGRAGGDFEGNFFVRCPFGEDFVVPRDGFEDLGAGRAGIGRGEDAAGLECAARDRLVSRQQLFHVGLSFVEKLSPARVESPHGCHNRGAIIRSRRDFSTFSIMRTRFGGARPRSRPRLHVFHGRTTGEASPVLSPLYYSGYVGRRVSSSHRRRGCV